MLRERDVFWRERVYWSHKSYGSAMRLKLRLIVAFIAALPLFTSWMFLFLPIIPKEVFIRYGGLRR